MTPLARTQQNFQSCMIYPEQIQDNSKIVWVKNTGRASPKRQLAIYSTAYRLRLKEVLENDYPAVSMAIGEDKFDEISDAYIKAHPSHYFSLREFGKNFANFIKTFESSLDNSWLYELALFEWLLGQAFDADDADILSVHDLSNVSMNDWPALQFIIHPSIQRIDFNWNIAEIWKTLIDKTPTNITALTTPECSWLIWRENLITQFRSLEQDEQLALDALISGTKFSEICEILGQYINQEEVPLRAAALLKGWISQGLISAKA